MEADLLKIKNITWTRVNDFSILQYVFSKLLECKNQNKPKYSNFELGKQLNLFLLLLGRATSSHDNNNDSGRSKEACTSRKRHNGKRK